MSVDGFLAADRVVTGSVDLGGGWIEIRESRIVGLGAGRPATSDFTRLIGTVIPGLVDIHVHGAVGFDFARADAKGVRAAAAHHAAQGTTTVVASVASSPPSSTLAALDRLQPLVGDGTLAGIHLEGPYLSPLRRGAHNPAHLRLPDLEEAKKILEVAGVALRSITIAPELEGAEPVIRLFAERGVVVAIGHTDCTASEARDAVRWGATHVTHLYNGMPEMRHRDPGPVGTALTEDLLTVELILDGHHLANEAAVIAWRSAGGRIVLVSDAMEATGYTDGDYEVAGSQVRVRSGVATVADGASLAGSTSPLAVDFAALLAYPGVSLLEAVQAVTVAPARAMHLGDLGLEIGAPADLILLDNHSFKINRVMRRGEWLASSS